LSSRKQRIEDSDGLDRNMIAVQVSRIDVEHRKLERMQDYVAEEKPLHIFLNHVHYVTILCSPTSLRELAVGHLLSEGLLKSVDEISELNVRRTGKCQVRLKKGVDAEKRIHAAQPFARLVSTTCGLTDYWPLPRLVDRLGLRRLQTGFRVRADVVLKSTRRLNTIAETFRRTGGVHVAALYAVGGKLVSHAEDVGRHNAADKVIGSCALRRRDLSKCFLASSGRLTGDIVLKAARMKIPVVSSLAAATDSGIEVAKRTGVTLVGFVRGQRMNVFAFPERIIIE
jgi:FdhD protein